jgi:hypothetical protein
VIEPRLGLAVAEGPEKICDHVTLVHQGTELYLDGTDLPLG